MKQKILVVARVYLPGERAGGPVRSIANMVASLYGKLQFHILCGDRDRGDKGSYDGLPLNEWVELGNARACYLTPEGRFIRIAEVLHEDYDVVYLNSFFDPEFSILPLILRKFFGRRASRWILAPRGEFSEGALGIKAAKKRAFILFSKMAGLHKGVIWHASTLHEVRDIERIMGRGLEIRVATNLAAPDDGEIERGCLAAKRPGELRIVSISRITRKKNLHFAINLLRDVDARVTFDIFGPIADEQYWEQCVVAIRDLPPNINVTYRGVLAHEQVGEVFSSYDVFLFPTLGENFGHACIEALRSGCVLLVSDQTPWLELEANRVGWALSLDNYEKFQEALRTLAAFGSHEMQSMRDSCRAYASEKLSEINSLQPWEALFSGSHRETLGS
ncbi:glycosyltransferase family 4 protein [Vulgatibacter incomptus]|uniref:Glycosyl transferase, group 1 n=1 Tax=Vulgatibacter incomptus TaxID=1391653 RepID=A0A0K1PI58_9BACT|nr:glycosyltransferase [Vulgatibacter incomptus]AKU93101.1 Glycosyl transferase, group 1 [Vulgatibacter incomptus]